MGGKQESVNLLYHQEMLGVESPLCANLQCNRWREADLLAVRQTPKQAFLLSNTHTPLLQTTTHVACTNIPVCHTSVYLGHERTSFSLSLFKISGQPKTDCNYLLFIPFICLSHSQRTGMMWVFYAVEYRTILCVLYKQWHAELG